MSKLVCYTKEDVAEFFQYLDDLSKTGMKMSGASPYLSDHFGLSTRKSQEVVEIWVKLFDEKTTSARRAEVAWRANQ